MPEREVETPNRETQNYLRLPLSVCPRGQSLPDKGGRFANGSRDP